MQVHSYLYSALTAPHLLGSAALNSPLSGATRLGPNPGTGIDPVTSYWSGITSLA
jgi:hypothetical protein